MEIGGTSAIQCLPCNSVWYDEDAVDAEDDRIYNDGYRAFTPEERKTYCRQVVESDGFDVDDFLDIFMFGKITPVDLDEYFLMDTGIPSAKEAIKEYNKKENAQFEFVTVDKANVQLARGARYYITFQARDRSATDGATKSFQALVLWGIPKPGKPRIEVICCRLKGAPNQDRIHIALL